MSRRAVIAALAALLLIAFVWFLWPSHEASVGDSPTASTPATSSRLSPLASHLAAPSVTEISHVADTLNSPTTDIRADLRLVSEILDTFRTIFPHDGNPIGSNAEITAALTGKNKIRFAFIPPTHPAINRAGELCDRWGTPFFFHAESGTRMEIRSAGPDKKMWTDDDAVLTP